MPSAEAPAPSAPLQLPLIDLSPFLTPSASNSSRAAVAEAVHSACSKFGFLYINGLDSVVSSEEMHHALAEARSFFLDTPESEKEELRIMKGDGARGWQKLGQNVTQYQGQSLAPSRSGCSTCSGARLTLPSRAYRPLQPTITKAWISVRSLHRVQFLSAEPDATHRPPCT
jgi:isopenicillin N synthase-like dioxygenase